MACNPRIFPRHRSLKVLMADSVQRRNVEGRATGRRWFEPALAVCLLSITVDPVAEPNLPPLEVTEVASGI